MYLCNIICFSNKITATEFNLILHHSMCNVLLKMLYLVFSSLYFGMMLSILLNFASQITLHYYCLFLLHCYVHPDAYFSQKSLSLCDAQQLFPHCAQKGAVGTATHILITEMRLKRQELLIACVSDVRMRGCIPISD